MFSEFNGWSILHADTGTKSLGYVTHLLTDKEDSRSCHRHVSVEQ